MILDLLKEYQRVEEAFQLGYESGVQILRKQHAEDMAKVVCDIFAHYYIAGRNALAIKLIVSAGWGLLKAITPFIPLLHFIPPLTPQEALSAQETYNLSEDLKKMLHDLASLSNHKNSKVALSARQVRHHRCQKTTLNGTPLKKQKNTPRF